MDWETQLITVYVTLSDILDNPNLNPIVRLSNNYSKLMSDAELLAIYIYGIQQGFRSQKSVHRHARNHLSEYFPNILKYKQFNRRLNHSSGLLAVCLEDLTNSQTADSMVLDSMPIILSKVFKKDISRRCDLYADVGYCATKKMTYYGVKLHVLAERNRGSIPFPAMIDISPASNHDITIFKQMVPNLRDVDIYADKAYRDNKLLPELLEKDLVNVICPVKKDKNKDLGYFDGIYNKLVSSVRQCIESFFAWVVEKTDIQNASKVRSPDGIFLHVYGRLVAALFHHQWKVCKN